VGGLDSTSRLVQPTSTKYPLLQPGFLSLGFGVWGLGATSRLVQRTSTKYPLLQPGFLSLGFGVWVPQAVWCNQLSESLVYTLIRQPCQMTHLHARDRWRGHDSTKLPLAVPKASSRLVCHGRYVVIWQPDVHAHLAKRCRVQDQIRGVEGLGRNVEGWVGMPDLHFSSKFLNPKP